MPSLWRLYRARHGPGLDGIGGLFADGRWHKRGERVVYFGGSAAIVVLERLAHTDPDLLPSDLRLARFEFSEPVLETKVEEFATLPANWNQDETATCHLGARWLEHGSSCLLAAPSAILPEECNFVLNPEHPDAKRLRMVRERRFTFDPRLILGEPASSTSALVLDKMVLGGHNRYNL
jgi:RES domain-containing protein